MPVIRNFGFLWERQYIDRGGGGAGNGGTLKGYKKGTKNVLIDFKEQIGVYALYDDHRSIVYIGQAGNGNATLFGRLKQHMYGGDLWNRWSYFSWVGFRAVNVGDGKLSKQQDVSAKVSGFTYGAALNEIEGILIELIEPRLNKKGGNLGPANEYFQTIPRGEVVTLEKLSEDIDQLKLVLQRK